jgi:hypothetical protein
MWVLVFIYFYDMTPYVEPVTSHTSMIECFQAREALAQEVGRGNGYFKAGQQALCINLREESN